MSDLVKLRLARCNAEQEISSRVSEVLFDVLTKFYAAGGSDITELELSLLDITKHGDPGRMFLANCRIRIEV